MILIPDGWPEWDLAAFRLETGYQPEKVSDTVLSATAQVVQYDLTRDFDLSLMPFDEVGVLSVEATDRIKQAQSCLLEAALLYRLYRSNDLETEIEETNIKIDQLKDRAYGLLAPVTGFKDPRYDAELV